MFSDVKSVGALKVKNETRKQIVQPRSVVSILLSALKRNTEWILSVEYRGGYIGVCIFWDGFSPAFLLSSFALILVSSNSISKQIGVYSLLLSISTMVRKQFYYVMLYFYSQLK